MTSPGLKTILDLRVQGAVASYPKTRRTILSARGVHKEFDGNVVLNGVDLEITEGEVVLLRGENGSGKTTLLNALTGNLTPDRGTLTISGSQGTATYSFPRPWWKAFNVWNDFTPEQVVNRGVGRTWQDIRLFGSLTLEQNVSLAIPRNPRETPLGALLPAFALPKCMPPEVASRKILAKLGLADRANSFADQVSLGQSKRVAIGRAIAAGARVLFLDEPLAGLDRRGVFDVLSYLRELTAEAKITMVIVEHIFNQDQIRSIATTDWLLVDGRLQSSPIDRDAVGRSDRADATQVADPVVARNAAKSWLKFFHTPESEITEDLLPRGATLTRIRMTENAKRHRMPVLEIENLVVRRGRRVVIGMPDSDSEQSIVGLSLIIYEHEIAVLQAPNGWGKSTLLAAIMGMVEIDSGTIRVNGVSLHSLPTWERARLGISALPSNENTFPSLLASEVASIARITPMPLKNRFAERRVSSLSGGERQALALQCLKPGCLEVLDEPFAGLDEASVQHHCHLRIAAGPRATLILSPQGIHPSK